MIAGDELEHKPLAHATIEPVTEPYPPRPSCEPRALVEQRADDRSSGRSSELLLTAERRILRRKFRRPGVRRYLRIG